MEDSRRVSRILGNKDKGIAKQPGESTVWRSAKKSQPHDDLELGKVNGRVPFGTWSFEMLRTVGRVPHTGGKRNSGCYS